MFAWLIRQNAAIRAVLGIITLAGLLFPVYLTATLLLFFADYLVLRETWPLAMALLACLCLAVVLRRSPKRRVIPLILAGIVSLPLIIGFSDFSRTWLGIDELQETLGRRFDESETRTLLIKGQPRVDALLFWHKIYQRFAAEGGRLLESPELYDQRNAALFATTVEDALFGNNAERLAEPLRYNACISYLRYRYVAVMRARKATNQAISFSQYHCNNPQCEIEPALRHSTGFTMAVGKSLEIMVGSKDYGPNLESCYQTVLEGTTQRLAQ